MSLQITAAFAVRLCWIGIVIYGQIRNSTLLKIQRNFLKLVNRKILSQISINKSVNFLLTLIVLI